MEWGKVGERWGACLCYLIDTFGAHLMNQKDDDELSKETEKEKTKKVKEKERGNSKLRSSGLKDKKSALTKFSNADFQG